MKDAPVPVESVPNLYQWTDVCNVYVFRDGDKALLIDLGNGSVLSHLPEIGVEQVEWILFTHHHREQCQGYPLLKDTDTQIAAPAAERVLFERPSDFAKVKPTLEDAWSVYGASYVRPPVQPIPVDRALAGMDTFTWHGYTFWCLETPGNSPGSMSYLLKTSAGWLAFSGDVILRGAKMHSYFDSEWDYGYGSGLRALHNSAALLRDFHPFLLLPAHGPVIKHPAHQLKAYLGKLRNLERMLIRGYDVSTYASSSQDMVSRPSQVPHVWQVSPHLFKLKGPEYFPNFSLILSDSGHALLVDCGLIDTTFLAQSLESMKRTYGLKAIDALIITHIHGDHFLQAPHIRQKWGTAVWALENMAPILEHPLRYNLAALLPAYRAGFDSIRVDRVFTPGETFAWEGYEFTIDWMPGQTEYALCLQGMIDGKKVVFTGDNIFGDPGNPLHSGHEALVARNSAILEEGYIYAADYLSKLKPDRLVGGHSYVMDKPAKMINRYQAWAQKMQKAFRSISHENDYRYWFDPYWVHAEPYRVQVKPGQSADMLVSVRNFVSEVRHYRIEIHTPSGIMAEPSVLEGKLPATSLEKLPVRVVTDGNLSAGVHRMAFDVTFNGKPYGEWFDAIVIVD
jgi:glyoxylase-like metal-dependent hydrolase (beta-lactamase superfamily II)